MIAILDTRSTEETPSGQVGPHHSTRHPLRLPHAFIAEFGRLYALGLKSRLPRPLPCCACSQCGHQALASGDSLCGLRAGPWSQPGTVHSAYCGSQPSSPGPQPRVPSGAESSCGGITPSQGEWSQPQGQPPSASLGFVPLAVRDIEHSPRAACPLGRFPPPVCQEMAFKSNSFADLPSPKTPRNGENRSSQSRVLTDPHQSRPPEGN